MGLECLSSVTPADNKAAEKMIADDRIKVVYRKLVAVYTSKQLPAAAMNTPR